MFNSDINLALPATPDSALELKTAFAITPLHYAVHALHKGVSIATGTWRPTSYEFPTITPQQSLLAENHRKIYLTAAVNITAGQLIYINAVGQAALASAAAAATLAQGYCRQSVLAAAVGEFVMFEGLMALGGVVAGTKYYSQNAAGAIGAAPGTVAQLVGVGIAANLIYLRIAMA